MDLVAGVFADRDFKAEEVVLREAPLVGAQHSRNKVSEMFCILGAIEQVFQGCVLLNSTSLILVSTISSMSNTSFIIRLALTLFLLITNLVITNRSHYFIGEIYT